MPYLMSFALEHEIVTFAWIDNASVQFPLNIYATKGLTVRWALDRSADFQSAVSPNCIRQSAGSVPRSGVYHRLAVCNSAIQQSTTRYDGALNRYSPLGRGRIVRRFEARAGRFDRSQRCDRQWSRGGSESVGNCSLSLRERVRVRGMQTLFIVRRRIIPGIVELSKSSGRAAFVCFGRIILEIKALSARADEHREQVLNYLHMVPFRSTNGRS